MKVVGVTSCATGIAHTYMAADAIQKICKKMGYECKVETQGAVGIENKLSSSDIATADLIIFANDVQVSRIERFEAYKYKIKKLSPHEVIAHPDVIFK